MHAHRLKRKSSVRRYWTNRAGRPFANT